MKHFTSKMKFTQEYAIRRFIQFKIQPGPASISAGKNNVNDRNTDTRTREMVGEIIFLAKTAQDRLWRYFLPSLYFRLYGLETVVKIITSPIDSWLNCSVSSNMASVSEQFRSIPVHMDFDGQRKAERIFQTIILVFAAIGLVFGYAFQQFSYTVYTLGAGFILSCLLTLPPWPMYRRKPLNWQKPRDETQESGKSKKKK